VGNIIGNRVSIGVEKYALGFEIAQLQFKIQFGVELPIVVDEVDFVILEFEIIVPVFLGQSRNAEIIFISDWVSMERRFWFAFTDYCW
jgi:hypothetical protein